MAVVTIPFTLIAAVFMFLAPELNNRGMAIDFPFGFFLFAPIAYGALGYIGGVVACVIYNLTLKLHGGIEYEISE